jgi:membrane-associated phospholipid phosphatase
VEKSEFLRGELKLLINRWIIEGKAQPAKTILLLVFTFIAVMVCYYVIDRPVAIWIARHHLRSIKVFEYLSHFPEIFCVAAIVLYFTLLARIIYPGRSTYLDQRFLMFTYAIAITYFLKDFFKFIFGRYWPETWIQNNPSLIGNNVYGFNFFHTGSIYGAFPSGHAAMLAAGISLLWFFYPRLWPVYILFALASVIGIIGMNFHFLSDVIAGGVLGYVVAYYTCHFFNGKILTNILA